VTSLENNNDSNGQDSNNNSNISSNHNNLINGEDNNNLSNNSNNSNSNQYDTEFEQFLRNNFYYDSQKALKLCLRNGLMYYFFVVCFDVFFNTTNS
jgi:hypothetical protein